MGRSVSASAIRFQEMALDGIQDLTEEEISALASAATWYAHYHAGIIAERADDQSGLAAGQRERYATLVDGLRKLGIRLPSVEMIVEDGAVAPAEERQAA